MDALADLALVPELHDLLAEVLEKAAKWDAYLAKSAVKGARSRRRLDAIDPSRRAKRNAAHVARYHSDPEYRERKLAYDRDNRARLQAAANTLGERRRSDGRPPCAWCGSSLESRRSDAVFCQRRCKQRARDAARAGRPVDTSAHTAWVERYWAIATLAHNRRYLTEYRRRRAG